MKQTKDFLNTLGLPTEDCRCLQLSEKRFPDGAQYRIEIPSTEGPKALQMLLEDAKRRRVPIHRISQGSGIMLLTNEEIKEMLRIGNDYGVEVSLFVGPRATFDTGAMIRTEGGKTLGWQHRGTDQLTYAIEDIKRGCDQGLRSILVADLGLLWVAGEMKKEGLLPSNLILKVSVTLPAANPAATKVLERLGAGTINIPTDLPLSHIAAMRHAVEIPIDMYVESPDGVGGFIRYYEVPKLIQIASPIYLKLGLKNSADIYPYGTHLEEVAIKLSLERVRRAQLMMEMIDRYCPEAVISQTGVNDLGIPQV